AEPDNRVYEMRFVRRMRARLLATGRYTPLDFSGLRTVMEIDDRITAPSFSFGGAAHYYRTQSALNYLPAIHIPSLLIQSRDDTFIPFSIFQDEALALNPCVELLATEFGGHLGFLARGTYRFWADRVIMDWIARL